MERVNFNSLGAFIFENKINFFDSLRLIGSLQQNNCLIANGPFTDAEIKELVELNTLTDDELKRFTSI